jgi:predicted RNase H-like HicB family nuclease
MVPADYLKRPYARQVVPEEDGSFRGEILEFPGCIAVGDTAADALNALEEVAESWLESTLARGLSVPEPIEVNAFSGKLVVRLGRGLHKKAARAAVRGASLNQLIVTAVAIHVGGAEATHGLLAGLPAHVTVNSMYTNAATISLVATGARQVGQIYMTAPMIPHPAMLGPIRRHGG